MADFPSVGARARYTREAIVEQVWPGGGAVMRDVNTGIQFTVDKYAIRNWIPELSPLPAAPTQETPQ